MILLRVNPIKCNGCRSCEDHLPKMIDIVANGSMMVSLHNPNVSSDSILRAVDVCQTKALSVEAA